MQRKRVAVSFILAVSATSVGWAEGTTYFRQDGGRASGESELPVRLDADHLVWKTNLAPGHSTPCVVNDTIFLTSHDAERMQLATVAIDSKNGRQKWARVAPAERIEEVHRVGSPASASPAYADGRLFVFFGSYGLLCYDPQGSLIWSRPLGPFQDEFGASSSPVAANDLVLLNEDHDTDNYLYAFDARSGNTRWQVPRDEFTRSYATPVIIEQDGKQQVVVAGAVTLTGYDLETGERLWWIHGLARIVNTTPAVHDDMLFVATWSPGGDVGERISMDGWHAAAKDFDHNQDGVLRRDELPEGAVLTRFFRIDINQDGALDQPEWEKHAQVFQRAQNAVLAIRPQGHGELGGESVLWKFEKGVPYVASPLYHDGVLYLVKDGGIFTSLDARTGRMLKQGRLKGRGNYYSSPVFADGKIYTASEQGVVTVLSAEGRWKILSSRDFGETIYATPVVDGDRLLIRSETALHCFALPTR